MKIYVVCDLEGAAGVVDHRKQCWFDGEYYQEARRIATTELNALVQGAIAGGATEVWAWDGHGNFPGGLDIELLAEGCKMVMGAGDGGPAGLDSSFDAAFHYGFHAMAGTPNAVLAHSFMPHIQEVWVNGLQVGEIGLNCAMAGSFGVPSVFISGDKAAIEEARNLIPDIVGVAVKEGLSPEPIGLKQGPALSLSVKDSCERIYEGAKVAMEKARRSQIRPFVVKPPYTFCVKYYEPKHADALAAAPGSLRVDEWTVEYEAESLAGFRM